MSVDAKFLRDLATAGQPEQIPLTVAEIQTVAFLAKNGGELEWHPEYAKPQSRALVQRLIDKRLVELIDRDGRTCMRLSDRGRYTATQIDAMDAAPKIEVSQPA